MVTLDQVDDWARSLPEVTQGRRYGNHTWEVAGKVFAWERAFSKADLRRFGDEPVPEGPILALATIPHFDGYAAVLVQLRVAGARAVREALADAWSAKAPARLRDA